MSTTNTFGQSKHGCMYAVIGKSQLSFIIFRNRNCCLYLEDRPATRAHDLIDYLLPSKTTLGQILENTASQNIYVGTHFYLTAKRDVHVVSVNRL